MNKLLVGLTTVALVASIAAPALAEDGSYQGNCGNNGMVCNVQMAKTNTGVNGIANSSSMDDDSDTEDNNTNGISTGQALSFADAKTVINSNLKEGCCDSEGDLRTQDNEINSAFVKNMQFVEANSGVNGIANSKAMCGESESDSNDNNEIWTGYAQATADAKTIANSNVQRGCCEDQYNMFNSAAVINVQKVKANTGMNGIGNSSSMGDDSSAHDNDGNLIVTGDALASASAFSLVNSNVNRGIMEPVFVE